MQKDNEIENNPNQEIRKALTETLESLTDEENILILCTFRRLEISGLTQRFASLEQCHLIGNKSFLHQFAKVANKHFEEILTNGISGLKILNVKGEFQEVN